MKQLEQEINDLRDECMRVKKQCDSQENKIKELSQRKYEFEDDQKFLDMELKEAKEQNKQIKISLGKAHNICEEMQKENENAKQVLNHVQSQIQQIQKMQQNQAFLKQSSILSQEDQSQIFKGLQNLSIQERQNQSQNFNQPSQSLNDTSYLQGTQQQNKISEESKVLEDPYNEEKSSTLQQMQSEAIQQSSLNEILPGQEDETIQRHSGKQNLNLSLLMNQNQQLKYMSKIQKGFKKGEGPVDLQNSKLYNARFTSFLYELLDATDDKTIISQSVEAYLRDDMERKQLAKQRLILKLEEQRRLNEVKKKYIEKQKTQNQNQKEAIDLLNSFKKSIDQVLGDKQKRSGNTHLTSDDLQNAEKKKVLELFVENDSTLSHILEFISNKLLEVPGNQGLKENSGEQSRQSLNKNINIESKLRNSSRSKVQQQFIAKQMTSNNEFRNQYGSRSPYQVQLNQIKSYSTENASSLYVKNTLLKNEQETNKQRKIQKIEPTINFNEKKASQFTLKLTGQVSSQMSEHEKGYQEKY